MSELSQTAINRRLELLGLTTQEILVLSNILSSTVPISTLDLEKLTKLPKHQIYRALKKLINESMIEELNSTIPKRYLSNRSTIKKYREIIDNKASQDKQKISSSSQDSIYNLIMDEEQKQVYKLLLKQHLSRNDLCDHLGFPYEKIRNITQKLEVKKSIESYKKGKIILYKSKDFNEIINHRIKIIEDECIEKKNNLNFLIDLLSSKKNNEEKHLSETKINDFQIIFKEASNFKKKEPIYSTLFIAIDSTEPWLKLLNEELYKAIQLAEKGFKLCWLVSEEFLSLINNLDIDSINSLLESFPNLEIRIYNKLIERVIIINSSEFYHFSFSTSFLDSVIYHNDSQVTTIKIQEFMLAWENSHDIRPLIIELLNKQDLINFIKPDQQIESIKTFNVALVGDKGVGKTTLIHRFLTGKFISNLRVTLGIKVDNLLVKLPDRLYHPASDIRLLVYDFGGQETFHNSYISQIADKKLFGLVFALNDSNSFKNLIYWIKFIYEHCKEDPYFILIGTKKDLTEDSTILDEIWDLRKEYRLDHFFETSALDGTNVGKVFESITELFIKELDNISFD
ncbi:MAG: Rab family GTPase [Candidatus Hodarchaeales archaeon]